MKKALITFVKAPVPGKVKTRLQADISKARTVRIYKSFITEIAGRFSGLKGVDRFLGCAPSTEHPFLIEIADKYRMKTFNQRGNNLGKKIVNAFDDHFQKGYSKIVLIGSDSPTIPKEYITMAFKELDKNDLVIGPCCDGGMYLVGAKKRIDAGLFRNIPWDSSDVLNLIMKKIFRKKVRFSLLPFWYDVDDIKGLEFLKLHLQYLDKKLPL